MSLRPDFASRSINSILVVRGIVFFSFCRPSRGPTSTILIRESREFGSFERLRCGSTAVARPRSRWRRRAVGPYLITGRRNDILNLSLSVADWIEVVDVGSLCRRNAGQLGDSGSPFYFRTSFASRPVSAAIILYVAYIENWNQ
jgi:hypothetical protein